MALRIGFLGAGKMAQAIAKGIISTGMVKADSVIASSPPQDQLYLDFFKVLRPSDPKIARVMPNTCVSVGEGACAFVASDDPSADTVTKLFSAVGTCHRLTDESQLDAVTALSGAGPAYVFSIAEALADGGVKMGLPRVLAVNLVSQTILGAAKMIQKTGRHTAVLRDEVTSPGGNTIEGLHFLEKSGMRAALMGAIEASTIKCRVTNMELKEQLKGK
ncbi:pyrroline-5-carboxylate reductase-like isoform X2 [Ischnura elegans]|uniref:pyrroline-5-carboxylate reductase-like isoform X2 n=1 Tax=Ischnura elegans TaxID=197161 RepID=UPI001ED89526|nr:pyrroline-5-carboxylate reductase-like isoform X2 [Ischnura elegans]